MNPEIRKRLEEIFERLDMHEGDWPGVEVFVSSEGRSIWGLLPEDLYQMLIELYRTVVEEEDAAGE